MPRVTSASAIAPLLASLALAGCGSGGAVVARDAGVDTGSGDAPVEQNAIGGGDAAVELPPPPRPYPRPSYQRPGETGLYEDIGVKHITPGLIPFVPTHKLWSDGAEKRRWLSLPPGTRIDTSDMDHWVFPVGTKLFKEFSVDGTRMETRLIERYGTGPEDYWMGAFVWNVDSSDAVLAPDGQKDILGSMHDAPSQKDCGLCHRGEAGRVLGFSAIQLSRATEPPAMPELVAMGLLSHPPADPIGYPTPGDGRTAAALGYLHANCAHCHNKSGAAWPDTQMLLRLGVADRDAATSGIAQSIVGKDITYWRGGAIKLRVAPGMPDQSGVVVRMKARGTMDAMPPLATERADDAGLALVRDWISGLQAP
jgi:hypothetical protein